MTRAAQLVERLDVTLDEWTPKPDPRHDAWVAKTTSAASREKQQTHQGNLRWSGDKEDRKPAPDTAKGTTRPR